MPEGMVHAAADAEVTLEAQASSWARMRSGPGSPFAAQKATPVDPLGAERLESLDDCCTVSRPTTP